MARVTGVWNPFPMDTTYFGEGNQAAMINYRVDDLDALLVELWQPLDTERA